MIKNCFYLLVLSLLSDSAVYAQDSVRGEAVTDTTEKTKTSLSLAAIYASDANYYGQSSTERLPYALTNASLNFPGGFFLSAGAYKLLNYGTGISGIDLSAGYDADFSQKFTGSFSFTRSFFPDSSLLLQSTNLNIASAALKYDWKWLSTGVNADYAIGDESALYVTFNISRAFDLGTLFSKKDYISFEPAFELIGGTQQIVTTEEIPNRGGNGGGGPGIPIVKKNQKLVPLPRRNNRQPQYRTVERSNFSLLSYNLNLPFSYNRANYAIEATYQGAVLSNKIEGVSQKLRSFLYLGFYYIF